MKLWQVLRQMFKFAFILCLLITFYLGTDIIVDYWQRNPGDFSFKEEYHYKEFAGMGVSIGDKETLSLIESRATSLETFKNETYITLIFFFLMLFTEYKINPNGHIFTKIKNGVKTDAIQDKDRKNN